MNDSIATNLHGAGEQNWSLNREQWEEAGESTNRSMHGWQANAVRIAAARTLPAAR